MMVNTRAIVLARIKYNDTDAVVKTYTAHTGFTVFFVRNFFKGRQARLKKALYQPNALLELTFDFKNKGQLEHIKEARIQYHYKNINRDFDKLNISSFLREILLESLKNEQIDPDLFQYIYSQFVALDQDDFHPDFHLIFLLKLTRYLGFFPDLQTKGLYFDLFNARFTDQIPLHPYLNSEESFLFKSFSGMIFATEKEKKINRKDRKLLIEILLRYYQQHLPQFKIPKSVKILNQIYE